MNLLNNQRKIFITESVWIAIMDSSHHSHDETKSRFKEILDQKEKLITSTYVLDAVLEYLKDFVNRETAKKFLDVIDRAVLVDSLKVIWLNRRLRRRTLSLHLDNDAKKLRDTFNFSLIRQKKIDLIFTLNPQFYEDKDLQCL